MQEQLLLTNFLVWLCDYIGYFFKNFNKIWIFLSKIGNHFNFDSTSNILWNLVNKPLMLQ
ncbi:hypothetical protein HPMG_01327 [Helicobacter pullorum MIT 98-5489]|uniref:Uncharacterized protein n=1 Tax=Helicobacter pullorum MIT 98-5489 TaxID=537972 RepID=C5F0W6_9HELI|nr:hypothetical protein HPMG_01327 [Helicobacter pullorum MIT 98-5489]